MAKVQIVKRKIVEVKAPTPTINSTKTASTLNKSSAMPPTTTTAATPVIKTNGDLSCNKLDCNVMKIVEATPKPYRIPQFVVDAKVADNPIPVNTLTSVFSVTGSTGKLKDIKSVHENENIAAKKIFRIIPNTHAHVVNYVVVDSDIAAKKQINTNDFAIKQQILDAQQKSANQILNKLMQVEGNDATTTINGLLSLSSKSSIAADTTAPDIRYIQPSNVQSPKKTTPTNLDEETPISVKIVPKLKNIANNTNTAPKVQKTIDLNSAPKQLQNILYKKTAQDTHEGQMEKMALEIQSLKNVIREVLENQAKITNANIEGPTPTKRIHLD